MAILKGYYNDYLLLNEVLYVGSDKPVAELAIQVTGANEGKLYQLEQNNIKSAESIDFLQYNHSSYNIFEFDNLINEVGLRKQRFKLEQDYYYQLLAYNEQGKIDVKVLGKGSFGTVFSAIDSNNNLVAIKQFKNEKEWQQELNNANMLKELGIPQGIVLPVDLGENSNRYHLVYPQGASFSYKMASLTIEQLLINFKQIVAALAWFHQQKIYHGDIKLDNIIFTDNGLAFIDCGLLTNKLTVIYNPTYCCPEVLIDKIDFKTEVLALGVCFFRVFTIYMLIMQGRDLEQHQELTKLIYQKQPTKNPNEWQPPENWRSPYAASFEELELLQQGVFSREFLPSQRATLTALFQLIKDMLILNSQHRPSSEEISQRIHKLQGSFS